MSAQTFLGMAQDLMTDADAKASFEADPDGFLASRGFDGLSPADVADAVGFVADTLPPGAAGALTDPDADGEALARLARLDPAELDGEVGGEDGAAEAGAEGLSPLLLEADPSGELDLSEASDTDPNEPDPHEPDPEEGDEMDEMPDGPEAAAVREPDEPDSTFSPVDAAEADPGFGVGWTYEDADDVAPAAPEYSHALDHPLDLDLDATHVDDLALGSTDPISDAFRWADEQELGHHDTAPVDEGDHDHHGAHHPGDVDHHDGLDL